MTTDMKKFLVSFLLIATCLLGACNTTPPDIDDIQTTPQDTSPQPPSEVVLNAPEACYTIISPEEGDEIAASAASELWKHLRTLDISQKLPVETDWVRNAEDAQNNKYEILVGNTNRNQSAAAAEKLSAYLDFAITVDGNKICIVANTDERMLDAIEYFKANVKATNGILSYTGVQTYIGEYDKYALPELKIGGASIETFSIVIPADASASEKKTADELQNYIKLNQGSILPIVTDTTAPTANEILIGKTNRPESSADVAENSCRYITVGTKLVLLSDTSSYYAAVKSQVISLFEDQKGIIATGLDVSTTYTGMDYFVQSNYAADLIAKIDEDLNLGVQALLSCCEYYNDSMVADTARGNQWVYSSNSKYVAQVCRFDDMLYNHTYKGCNCAGPTNWAFIDMEIMPDTYRFWGGSSGEFARREKVEPYISLACDIYEVYNEGKTFMQLYNEGRIKTGDIFLGDSHTWIYRGAQSFYAAGHDGKWHTDPNAYTEDTRKAVFENWVLSFDQCSTNRNYKVRYIIRIKDDYVPKYFRNTDGQLVENPLYTQMENQ